MKELVKWRWSLKCFAPRNYKKYLKIIVELFATKKKASVLSSFVMIGDVFDWDAGFQLLCLVSSIMGLRQSKVGAQGVLFI